MTLQRRHFEFIARIVRGLPSSLRDEVATHFTRELRPTNPNFNAHRFLEACAPSERN
jgi:hypothetical protein